MRKELVTVAVLALMASSRASAQSSEHQAGDQSPEHARGHLASKRAATPYTPPRTADGQPDFQGFWRHRTTGMPAYNLEGGGNAAHLILSAGCAQGVVGCERSDEELSVAVAARTAEHPVMIVDPPDGRIPFQPWAAARKKDVVDNHTNPQPQHVDPQARCFLPGVPRMTYQENNAFQITQFPGYIMINYEFVHAYRVIPLSDRPHLGKDIKLWMGDSRARWEGNTLVVDTTNHNDSTWFDITGTIHSDALHVVERFTMIDANTINYEARIEDSLVFTKPWRIQFPVTRNNAQSYEVFEMACHEGVRMQHFVHRPAR